LAKNNNLLEESFKERGEKCIFCADSWQRYE